MEYNSVIIKNEIISFAAIWMDLQSPYWMNEVRQRKRVHTEWTCDSAYMGNLKRNDTTEFVYKREPNSQTWRGNLEFPGRKG